MGGNLIITKVDGGTAKDLTFLSESDQKQVALNIIDALSELDIVDFKTYTETFRQLGIKTPEISDAESDYQKYVIDSFYPYKEIAPTDAHTRWLEDVIRNFTPHLMKGNKKVFWHGDPSAANIIVDKNLYVNFIDWSLSRFHWTAKGRNDYSLSYLSNHVPVVNKFEKDLIEYTAHKNGLNVNNLSELVLERRKQIKYLTYAGHLKCIH